MIDFMLCGQHYELNVLVFYMMLKKLIKPILHREEAEASGREWHSQCHQAMGFQSRSPIQASRLQYLFCFQPFPHPQPHPQPAIQHILL